MGVGAGSRAVEPEPAQASHSGFVTSAVSHVGAFRHASSGSRAADFARRLGERAPQKTRSRTLTPRFALYTSRWLQNLRQKQLRARVLCLLAPSLLLTDDL